MLFFTRATPSPRRALFLVHPRAKLLLKRDCLSQWCTSEFKGRHKKIKCRAFSVIRFCVRSDRASSAPASFSRALMSSMCRVASSLSFMMPAAVSRFCSSTAFCGLLRVTLNSSSSSSSRLSLITGTLILVSVCPGVNVMTAFADGAT